MDLSSALMLCFSSNANLNPNTPDTETQADCLFSREECFSW